MYLLSVRAIKIPWTWRFSSEDTSSLCFIFIHSLYLNPNIFSGTAPDVSVYINGSIDIGLIGIIELNTVGVAIVPQFHDCSISVLTHIGLDLISYLEAELIGDETCFEALRTRSVSELGIN